MSGSLSSVSGALGRRSRRALPETQPLAIVEVEQGILLIAEADDDLVDFLADLVAVAWRAAARSSISTSRLWMRVLSSENSSLR